jgi:organic hydroperoxide reductase OsmC/OhrA
MTGASAPDKPKLDIATPPEFVGGVEGVWSPEELLVSAVASCYSLTFAAIAERLQIPLLSMEISGTGHVSRRDDGRYGFVAIELDVEVETPEASRDPALRAARTAEHRCIVSLALDIPVHVGIDVRVPEPAF